MVFSSVLFLFAFLPVFFLVYFILPLRFRNAWALVGSGAFYAWGAPSFIGIALGTSAVDYVISRRLQARDLSESKRKFLLWCGILLNLSLLFYFKYANFFIEQVDDVLDFFDRGSIHWTAVALPIGISFITFEKISYLVDVWARKVQPAPTFVTYLLFLALFPHLIAGPIFRYHDISDQLLNRPLRMDDVFRGFVRFSLGLAKKSLLADPLSEVVDKIFHLHSYSLTPAYAWLGAACYALQIYFDFSGYSDMAIGLGRMMGFHFLENFNRPYISLSVTEFWRRWHISLTNWMREYLYIPLGGNRVSPRRTAVNLWTVFLLSGLWHGANWTFIVWGCWHGFFLILERNFLLSRLERVPAVLRSCYTLFAILLSWVIFRSENLSESLEYIQRMFSFTGTALYERTPRLADIINNRAATAVVIGTILAVCPDSIMESARCFFSATRCELRTAACGIACLLLFFLSTLSLVNSQFHPFIYFRF
jgi:alginate O-acetyltransferase complex protein AlgI